MHTAWVSGHKQQQFGKEPLGKERDQSAPQGPVNCPMSSALIVDVEYLWNIFVMILYVVLLSHQNEFYAHFHI